MEFYSEIRRGARGDDPRGLRLPTPRICRALVLWLKRRTWPSTKGRLDQIHHPPQEKGWKSLLLAAKRINSASLTDAVTVRAECTRPVRQSFRPKSHWIRRAFGPCSRPVVAELVQQSSKAPHRHFQFPFLVIRRLRIIPQCLCGLSVPSHILQQRLAAE